MPAARAPWLAVALALAVATAAAGDPPTPAVDPRVVAVLVGPSVHGPQAYRPRAVVWRDGSEMRLRIERIAADADAPRIARVFAVDLSGVGEPVYTLDELRWHGPDRLELRINALPHRIEGLQDGEPRVSRVR